MQIDKQYPSQTDPIDSHADWQTIPFSDWSYCHADWQTIPISDWSSRYPWRSLSLADTTPNTLYIRSATVSRNTVLVLDRALQTFTAMDKVLEGPTPATIYSDWQGCEWTGPWKQLQHMTSSNTQSQYTPRGELDAPLRRYTGVTIKVPFKLRPKDRKKVSDGCWKMCRAPRGNKNRGNRGIKFDKTEQLLPFGKLRLTECDSCFGTDFRQLCFGGWTRQNHWLLGLLTAVNSMHASSAQVFPSLSDVLPVRAY